jgi:large subunit ribosomal protein L23
MAFLDILRGRKREEGKPERLQKGAFSPKANQPLAEKQIERFAKKREKIYVPKKEKKPETAEPSASKKEKVLKTAQSLLAAELLLKPHITEQSNYLAQKNIYTFRVKPSANKTSIKRAIKEMYGFEPVKISIVNMPAKKRKVRGKTGIKSGFKKANVYLKEGEKIEFV